MTEERTQTSLQAGLKKSTVYAFPRNGGLGRQYCHHVVWAEYFVEL
jgi:hypothetical protein